MSHNPVAQCHTFTHKITQSQEIGFSQNLYMLENMPLSCRYCQSIFACADSRIHCKNHSCKRWFGKPQEDGFPTEKQHGLLSVIEMKEAFRFKTPSSILAMGPSGCSKTCFNPPNQINYSCGAWQDGFLNMKKQGIRFHEGIPTISHLPNGCFRKVDYLC